ncbi:MAG TPA: CPBP family intramembrane glutamic endopeptidase [Vicinamibacterales bacterium]|nr:CPBP family intramembrane glutamic endopeptidase [Vicinamibacterales bacterium]
MRKWRAVIGTVHSIESLGWYHLAVFGVLVPFLAWRSQQRFNADPQALPRVRVFQSVALTLIVLGLLSWITAGAHGLDLFPPITSPLLATAVGVASYAIAVVLMRPRWRTAVLERRRVVHLFTPETRAERGWWIVVSTLAGVSEEISWRGVQPVILAALCGSPWLAAIVCAIAFGVAHVIQGWRSVAAIAVFALGFQATVWLTGTLVVAIVVHAAYDITAGFAYARLARELGAPPAAAQS